eukprot:363560-Chlamydomonas_euryale.AAC.1
MSVTFEAGMFAVSEVQKGGLSPRRQSGRGISLLSRPRRQEHARNREKRPHALDQTVQASIRGARPSAPAYLRRGSVGSALFRTRSGRSLGETTQVVLLKPHTERTEASGLVLRRVASWSGCVDVKSPEGLCFCCGRPALAAAFGARAARADGSNRRISVHTHGHTPHPPIVVAATPRNRSGGPSLLQREGMCGFWLMRRGTLQAGQHW